MSSSNSRLFPSLAAALVVAACSDTTGSGSTTPGNRDPGSISLSISMSTASVAQGGSQPVTATVTRTGGFSGPVNLYVTGQPSGVTAAVSNMQTTGAVTTATVTIFVGAVSSALYPLVVHGTGTGVGEVTQAFTLLVPGGLGFSVSLSPAALSIEQGASTPTTTVRINRFTHWFSVGLYVTGLPPGVTDSFSPSSWPASDNTLLTLTVGATALPGSYNLQVNAFDPEQEGDVSTPLTLTITAAPPGSYALTLSSPALSIVQGGSTPTTVNVVRHNFTGPVTLFVTGDYGDVTPPGVTAEFAPNPTTGNGSVLTFTVDATAVPGVYELGVGSWTSTACCKFARLTLTVTSEGMGNPR